VKKSKFTKVISFLLAIVIVLSTAFVVIAASPYSTITTTYECPKSLCFKDLIISGPYLTQHFPIILEKNNLKKIRFHDLRHSCASLLISNGVPIKQVSEWLGHSDISTTANIYVHLTMDSKIESANAILGFYPTI
jgi:hypothetical protein